MAWEREGSQGHSRLAHCTCSLMSRQRYPSAPTVRYSIHMRHRAILDSLRHLAGQRDLVGDLIPIPDPSFRCRFGDEVGDDRRSIADVEPHNSDAQPRVKKRLTIQFRKYKLKKFSINKYSSGRNANLPSVPQRCARRASTTTSPFLPIIRIDAWRMCGWHSSELWRGRDRWMCCTMPLIQSRGTAHERLNL